MAKKKKKISSLFIFPLLLIIIVCSYLIRYIYFRIETEIVKYGSIQNSFESKGLIIRNEYTYGFSEKLKLKNKIPEGERVPNGKKIVEIIKGEDEIQGDLLFRINKLEERIKDIENNEKDYDIFEKDKEKLDNSINNKIELIKRYSEEGNLESLNKIKTELSDELYKKSLINGNDSFSGKNLEQLIKERDQLLDLYNNNIDAIFAKSSGIVSYKLDGLEQSLNPISLDKISINDIRQIISSNEIDNGKTEYEGVKIIEDYIWYISCIIKDDEMQGMEEGNSISLAFNDKEKEIIKAKIYKISEQGDNERIVTFQINEYLEEHYNSRIANITIIRNEYEGFLVSKSCIVEKDKQNGIYIIKKGIIRFVPVEILALEANKALIKNIDYSEGENQNSGYIIKVYDEVIKNTKNIKVNQRIL